MQDTWFVLLDRDGTLIEDRHYLSDPDGVVLLPGVVAGLSTLTRAGFHLAVVTNQSGIGRGMYTETAMHTVNARMTFLLAEHGIQLDGIYFCPHAPQTVCDCRKPLPGLFLQAARTLGTVAQRCYIIGDKAADIDLGLGVGARSVLVRTGYGAKDADAAARATMVAEDLRAAADWIVADRAQHTAEGYCPPLPAKGSNPLDPHTGSALF